MRRRWICWGRRRSGWTRRGWTGICSRSPGRFTRGRMRFSGTWWPSGCSGCRGEPGERGAADRKTSARGVADWAAKTGDTEPLHGEGTRMRFALTREQREFRDAVDALLRAAGGLAAARAWAGGDTKPGLEIWRGLAAIGLHSLASEYPVEL